MADSTGLQAAEFPLCLTTLVSVAPLPLPLRGASFHAIVCSGRQARALATCRGEGEGRGKGIDSTLDIWDTKLIKQLIYGVGFGTAQHPSLQLDVHSNSSCLILSRQRLSCIDIHLILQYTSAPIVNPNQYRLSVPRNGRDALSLPFEAGANSVIMYER